MLSPRVLLLQFLLFVRENGREKQEKIRGKRRRRRRRKRSKRNCISIERVKSISIEFFFLNRSIFLLSREEKDGEDDFGPIRIAHSRGKDRN